MKRLVAGDKQRIADWIAERAGCSKWQHNFQAIGIEQDGRLVGGSVIDNYVKDTRCSLHVAGERPGWATRLFFRTVFDYVFNQLNCKVAVAPIASTNTVSLDFAKRLGFTEAGRIQDGTSEGDLVLLQMPKAGCRWLEKKP